MLVLVLLKYCRVGAGEVAVTFQLVLLLLLLFYIYIYFLLCRVFVSMRGLSPVAASGGHSSLRCAGLSLSRPLLLWSTGSRRAGSVVVAQGPSRSAACGIFPDQGSNPCPLHWQTDSQPLRHQGSPQLVLLRRTVWQPGRLFWTLKLSLYLSCPTHWIYLEYP